MTVYSKPEVFGKKIVLIYFEHAGSRVMGKYVRRQTMLQMKFIKFWEKTLVNFKQIIEIA